ncbi:hypothetical protein [Halorussus salinisoli]|uniref:hypothetical protein n=1 Tax=Halorussus salinisoli TaxID=2558242 RepID=UPI0010C22BA2|nr:hypothetical protein [Halorussus salinisoli]
MWLYDDAGTELGKVEVEPFDFDIAESARNPAELDRVIRQHDVTTERTGGYKEYTDPDTGETVIEHWDGERPITD